MLKHRELNIALKESTHIGRIHVEAISSGTLISVYPREAGQFGQVYDALNASKRLKEKDIFALPASNVSGGPNEYVALTVRKQGVSPNEVVDALVDAEMVGADEALSVKQNMSAVAPAGESAGMGKAVKARRPWSFFRS